MGAVQETLRRVLRAPRQGVEQSDATAPAAAVDSHIIDRVRPYTMTSDERLQALIDAVRYCVKRDIPGAFAECGVWRGGSVLAMLLTLQEEGVSDCDVYLFDTFEGMTAPTEHDVSALDPPALQTWQQSEGRPWAQFFDETIFNEDQVRKTLYDSGYPEDKLHFIKGPVEDTLPQNAPDQLALLRLDTDWYESTKHELEHLYPALETGGVLIIDDYGHWEGARRAVDEYLEKNEQQLLLNRIDYTGRIAVKH
jgi:O-methyltransferase